MGYVIDNEQLMKEWNWEKNNNLGVYPDKIKLKSKKKVWWICSKKHEWMTPVAVRTQGCKCPYCAGKYAITGENDLQTLRPDLMEEWDWDKNTALGIDPSKLKITSNIRVWWKCKEKEHSYETMLSSRTFMNSGCPYCSGSKILPGFNDLQTLYPDIMIEWDWNKNINIDPSTLAPKTHKKVWWLCHLGHSYLMSVDSKTAGHNCPYCSSHKVLSGFNDLATTDSWILSEWDYDKNIISPTEVSAGSHTKVWWKCTYGHSWSATIKNRIKGAGCPECQKSKMTSFPERSIYFYIKNYFDNAIWSYSDDILNKMEIDIFIPSLKIGIEYDGEAWHKNIKRDLKKDRLCEELGIHLIRIREPKCPIYDSSCKFIYLSNLGQTELENAIYKVLNILGVFNSDIDINRDTNKIEDVIMHYIVEHSILSKRPELASEWHPTKNGNLKPEYITYGSHKKIWWICKEGHEWCAIAKDRSRGIDCPVCRKKKINNIKLIDVKGVIDNGT